jgi:hypothetical protein
MAHGHNQRVVADRLQRSLHTVSVYVNQTAKALCRLGKTIIRPTATELPHPYIARNSRYYPWFAVSRITYFKYKVTYIYCILCRISDWLFDNTVVTRIVLGQLMAPTLKRAFKVRTLCRIEARSPQ